MGIDIGEGVQEGAESSPEQEEAGKENAPLGPIYP